MFTVLAATAGTAILAGVVITIDFVARKVAEHVKLSNPNEL